MTLHHPSTYLNINPNTLEPQLRLDPPYSHIFITPPRMEDVSSSVDILNDERVFSWMGFNGQYTTQRAEKWVEGVKDEAYSVYHSLTERNVQKFASGCPVRHIRAEIHENGRLTEVFLGDIGITRANWAEVLDKTEKQRLVEENLARNNGDPNIVWQLGYYLASSQHGKGIMTAVVRTLLHKWAIPCMNASRIRITPFTDNEASVRIAQKNGFKLVNTVHDCVEVEGVKRGLHVLEWQST